MNDKRRFIGKAINGPYKGWQFIHWAPKKDVRFLYGRSGSYYHIAHDAATTNRDVEGHWTYDTNSEQSER